MDYIFIGKRRWEAVSLSLNEKDGKQMGLSAVIVIPDGEGINYDCRKLVEDVEAYGITEIIKDGDDVMLNRNFTIVAGTSQNDGNFYLGEDADGNKRYAKATIAFNVINVNENPTYLDDLKSSVIKKLSDDCQKAIEDGVTIKLSDEKEYSFSYKATDQTNIKEMFDAVTYGATAYPYHENGGNCQIFSSADITAIYMAMVKNKTHHTTYFNQLRQYVKSMDKASDIMDVKYGTTELTGEYFEIYTNSMNIAEEQFAGITNPLMHRDKGSD